MISLDNFTEAQIASAIEKAFPEGLIDHFWFIAHAVEDSKSLMREYMGLAPRLPFEDMPQEYRERALHAVMAIWKNPDTGPAETHEQWVKRQIAAGWKYGEKFIAPAKESPALRPFAELPEHMRVESHLMWAVCRSLFKLLIVTEVAKAAMSAAEKPKLILEN